MTTADPAQPTQPTAAPTPGDPTDPQAAYAALYAYTAELAAELKDAYDMLRAAQSQAVRRGQENAALRVELAATQEALGEAVAAENDAAAQAVALHQVVLAHGGCPGIAAGAYADPGTVRTCPSCFTRWEAVALQVTDPAVIDGRLTGAETTVTWRLAATD